MKNVVITGANRGIGLELARAYAQSGAAVWGLCRTAGSEESNIRWLSADVTDPAALAAAASHVETCDLLICNAGVYLDRDINPFTSRGSEWADTFAVNVEGVFRTIQSFDTCLKDGSKIAIISSKMGCSSRAHGGSYIYRASKAAVTNLACNLATDFRSRGVRSGCLSSGLGPHGYGNRCGRHRPCNVRGGFGGPLCNAGS